MSTQFKNSKEFLKLQKIWDKKLADSGFEDIEQREDGALKIWSDRFCGGYHTEITMEAKRDYYRAVGHFLYDHKFLNAAEKKIWKMHGEAISIRNIVKTLTAENLWIFEGGVPHKRAVHETIQKLVKIMLAKIEKDNLSE